MVGNPSRKEECLHLPGRKAGGWRESNQAFLHSSKNLQEFLRVMGKAGFGLLTPLAPEWGGEMLLLGRPGVFTLISVCLGTI